MSNINPDMKPYKKLPPFKIFTLTNFPFIDEDFDALTNYELMCKIVEYLNGVIAGTNTCNENIQALYDAFMELQQSVADQIAEGFSELNVQEEVNHKLDEMVENGELNDAIINAINELNPSILDNAERINVLPFNNNLVSTTAPYVIIVNNLLNPWNKQLLIECFNNMLKYNSNFYLVANPLDYGRVIYYLLSIEDYPYTETYGIKVIMNTSELNLGVGTEYVESIILVPAINNGEVTDLAFDSSYSHNYNLIRLNNQNPFTPISDYQPATKKYVDDSATTVQTQYSTMPTASEDNLGKIVQYVGTTTVDYITGHFYQVVSDGGNPETYSWSEITFGGGGGVTPVPIYNFVASNNQSYILFNEYGSFNLQGNDVQTFIDILNDAHNKGLKLLNIQLKASSPAVPQLISVDMSEVDFTSSSGYIKVLLVYDSQSYQTSLAYGYNNRGYNKAWYIVRLTITAGVITAYGNIMGTAGNYSFLPTNNNESYTPTGQYNPATKGYVDNYLTTISGYDATKTQTLKNVTGTLTWVDD